MPVAFDALLFDLTLSICKDKGNVIASAYDMGLTTHTPEKSLLPIIGEGIITFDIHKSAIEGGWFQVPNVEANQ
jgi:hypothetical protein